MEYGKNEQKCSCQLEEQSINWDPASLKHMHYALDADAAENMHLHQFIILLWAKTIHCESNFQNQDQKEGSSISVFAYLTGIRIVKVALIHCCKYRALHSLSDLIFY